MQNYGIGLEQAQQALLVSRAMDAMCCRRPETPSQLLRHLTARLRNAPLVEHGSLVSTTKTATPSWIRPPVGAAIHPPKLLAPTPLKTATTAADRTNLRCPTSSTTRKESLTASVPASPTTTRSKPTEVVEKSLDTATTIPTTITTGPTAEGRNNKPTTTTTPASSSSSSLRKRTRSAEEAADACSTALKKGRQNSR
jgi:hypothetical protein